jgi:hypothetical protein
MERNLKRRLGWSGLAAVVGCGACCVAIPLLSAVGLGGAAAALAGWFGPGTELLAGSAAGAVAFGVLMVLERRSKSVCSWPGAADASVACTADLRNEKAVQKHLDDYRAVFGGLVHSERIPNGFRWTFRAEEGLEARLRELAQREHACCGFFGFELSSDRDRTTWTVTADERAQSVVDEFFRLPERLRSGHDLEELKNEAEAAGLTFTGAKSQPATVTRSVAT